MKLLKNHAYIHGFEDYNIVCPSEGCFFNTWGFYIPYSFNNAAVTYIINKDLSFKVYNETNPKYDWINTVKFEPELVSNHKELLETATKVFTHPTCKLSRSMMAEKYKKSLNPYFSDVVVIPNPEYGEVNLCKQVLFINEESKIIVMVSISTNDADNRISNACEGTKFKDLITCSPNNNVYDHYPYKIDDLMQAELFYYGEVIYIPNSVSWAAEVLIHSIPTDKIVFEESVQESLSNESNQLDFDSLCSIMDMLNSSDEDTVSAGLKSLSMMDWMHYPQSIKYILNNTNNKWNWVYNKACNSTSVKYMMKTLTGGHMKRSRWPGDFDSEIYEKDFELFKQLKCHYDHIQPDDIMSNMKYIDFMRVNSDGTMVPNIKQIN